MAQKTKLKKILKQNPYGLVIIYTGNGKGKTTASLGLALRALAANLKVSLIQFLKSDKASGEINLRPILPKLKIQTFGTGFVNPASRQEVAKDKILARKGIKYIQELIKKQAIDVLILDEINVALSFKILSLKEVISIIKLAKASSKPIHLVLTGRGCPKSLYSKADLVTEMQETKHPFTKGYLAVKGIDY